jgi:hypothetical protein
VKGNTSAYCQFPKWTVTSSTIASVHVSYVATKEGLVNSAVQNLLTGEDFSGKIFIMGFKIYEKHA